MAGVGGLHLHTAVSICLGKSVRYSDSQVQTTGFEGRTPCYGFYPMSSRQRGTGRDVGSGCSRFYVWKPRTRYSGERSWDDAYQGEPSVDSLSRSWYCSTVARPTSRINHRVHAWSIASCHTCKITMGRVQKKVSYEQ